MNYESLYCIPVTYVISYSNHISVKNNFKKLFLRSTQLDKNKRLKKKKMASEKGSFKNIAVRYCVKTFKIRS